MKYQIAEYTLDTARYRITHGDAVIPAEPKVFDLLVYLIRHRDRVLSREELFREVWDGREVSDATLSNHVKSARKILGDNGDLQQTILTIRGRGYQFVAPVTVTPEGASTSAEPAPQVAKGAVHKLSAWRWPAAIVGVLLIASLIGWRAFESRRAQPAADVPYLVVVPFDVSGDAPDAWRPFADQMTREVIRNLRKISGLRVVPAVSAFTFKDNKTRDHIRSQLPDVRYVLDGVVSISADKTLRVTPELEDLNQGRVVWDKDYVGRTDDANIFAMQSGIATAVSDSLKVAILAEEWRALDEFPTTNLKAYEAYVAGRYQLDLLQPRIPAAGDRAVRSGHRARSEVLRCLHCPQRRVPPVVRLLRAADQHAAEGGRFDRRGAGAAPRFRGGLVFAGSHVRDGVALEGCLDRVEQGEASRSDARANGVGLCDVLLGLGEAGKGEARAGRRRSARPAERGGCRLGQLGALHGGRTRGGADLGRQENAATPGHRDAVLGSRRRFLHCR
jgi:DNA-binding winged helix-turn-helix (wHTH) protein/TolB-like protein